MIADYFKENMNLLQRGENSYSSGNVVKMLFDPECKPAVLKGTVDASMKKRSYNVEMLADPLDGIIDGKCSCPRGQAICHHMAALCIYAHHNVSVTDKLSTWNAPKRAEDVNVNKLKDLFPLKKEYCAIAEPMNEVDMTAFKKSMFLTNVGFSWLLRPTPESPETLPVTHIEDILFCADYNNSQNKMEYVIEKCKISHEDILRINSLTVGQAVNENWLLARKLRLTGSKFGMVLAACKRERFPISLFKNLMEGYDLGKVQAVQWGKEHEKVAVKVFETATGMKVTPAGLYLHTCGFIGASPDGFVNEECVIEVKCPFKYRNVSLQQALRNEKNYIVHIKEDNDLIINKNHEYWHQIQGALHLTARSKCYLIIWTPTECQIIEIHKDDDWKENITVLQHFYLNQFVPFVVG